MLLFSPLMIGGLQVYYWGLTYLSAGQRAYYGARCKSSAVIDRGAPNAQTLQMQCAHKHSTAAAGEAVDFFFFLARPLNRFLFFVVFLTVFLELEILFLIFSLNSPWQCFLIPRDAPLLPSAQFYLLEKVC